MKIVLALLSLFAATSIFAATQQDVKASSAVTGAQSISNTVLAKGEMYNGKRKCRCICTVVTPANT